MQIWKFNSFWFHGLILSCFPLSVENANFWCWTECLFYFFVLSCWRFLWFVFLYLWWYWCHIFLEVVVFCNFSLSTRFSWFTFFLMSFDEFGKFGDTWMIYIFQAHSPPFFYFFFCSFFPNQWLLTFYHPPNHPQAQLKWEIVITRKKGKAKIMLM